MRERAFNVEREGKGGKSPGDSDGKKEERPNTIKRVPISKHERER